MRIKTISKELYQFEELSDSAKETAINELIDINIDFEWWLSTYEDSENIDLKITGFDLDRSDYCNIDFIYSAIDTAKSILINHGKNCDSFKLAKKFVFDYDVLNSLTEIFDILSDDYTEFYDSYNNYSDDLEELISEFKSDLSNEYKKMLAAEFEYLTSSEAIIESIEANEYEFSIEGNF